ncbi:unnamed protein product, partial [Didymodactylos carnosus]
MPKAELG